MEPLLQALAQAPLLRELLAVIDNGRCPAALSGLSAIHRACLAAALDRKSTRLNSSHKWISRMRSSGC